MLEQRDYTMIADIVNQAMIPVIVERHFIND